MLTYLLLLARRSPRQPLQGAVFALHARENRVFYVRGDFPSDNSPILIILFFRQSAPPKGLCFLHQRFNYFVKVHKVRGFYKYCVAAKKKSVFFL